VQRALLRDYATNREFDPVVHAGLLESDLDNVVGGTIG
jgi:hypothetical protein